jgi:hypothetical protein
MYIRHPNYIEYNEFDGRVPISTPSGISIRVTNQ